MRRSRSAGCCCRCRARRACACMFDPKPDYARANFEIVAAGQGVEVVGGPTRLYLSSNVPAPYLLDGSPIRIDRPIFFSLSAGRPPQVDSGPAAENALEQTIRGWRVWTKTCGAAVVRARVGAALGALSQAPRLQRHRRDHRRGHDQHPRSDRVRAHVGLPLLLAARRRLRRRSAAAAGPPRRGRSVRALSSRDGRQRTVAADVRHHRQARPARGDRADTARLRRRRAGAHRQRRLRAASARRQRRDGALPRDDPHRSARGLGGPDAGAAPRASRRGGDGVVRARRHRPLGVPHAAASLHLLEGDVLGRRASRRRAGRIPRHARTRAAMGRVGGREAADRARARLQQGERLLHAVLRRRASRCVEPAAAGARPDRSARSQVPIDRSRLREAAGAGRIDAALQRTSTTSATPPARFRSARSGGWKRWR